MGRLMSSDFRLVKCTQEEHKLGDRISQCPDEILVAILSYLPLEDAARTSVLSKRWVNLWFFVSGLDFHSAKLWKGPVVIGKVSEYQRLRRRNCRNYVKWVNKVLQSHKATALDVFRIRFGLSKSSGNDIDKWLHYASTRRVQDLELNLLIYNGCHFSAKTAYAFPVDLLGPSYGKSFVSTDSCGNGIHSDTIFGFKTLRNLALKNVTVCRKVVKYFMYNCPFLESLTVNNSHILDKLEVCGPSLALKHLEISDCLKMVSLIVSDTNIVSLRYDYSFGTHLLLKNTPMLVDVNISWQTTGFRIDRMVSFFSCCLSILEVLTLKIQPEDLTSGQAYDEAFANGVPQLTRLKQLVVCVWAFTEGDESLMQFTSLIRASPNLEKFVVKCEMVNEVPQEQIYRPCRKGKAFPLQHLKVVELQGYTGCVAEVELVEYFVENAAALERIITDSRDQFFENYDEADSPLENPNDAIYRNRAKQQLQGIVPSHVELVIL